MSPSNEVVPTPPCISARDVKFATILVGEEAARFVIHEELLTYHSPYFRAALKGGFAEAVDRTVRLRETDAVLFEFFVHWLYHARLPNEDDNPKLAKLWALPDDHMEQLCDSLVRLYVFCDKYDVPILRRHCLDQLFAHYESHNSSIPKLSTVTYAFKNALSDSPLCRFLIDYYCRYADAEEWSEECETHEKAPPLNLLSSALQRYTDYAARLLFSGDALDALEACDYHEHKDREEREPCAAEREV